MGEGVQPDNPGRTPLSLGFQRLFPEAQGSVCEVGEDFPTQSD